VSVQVPTKRSAPVKVLLIAPPIRVTGGQSVQANRLYSGLSRNSAVKVTFQPTTSLLNFFEINLGSVPYLRTILNSLTYLSFLIWRAISHDVIHIFSAGYSSFLLIAAPALVLGRLFRKKTILHYHDGRAADHLEKWPGTVALCNLADVIITPSSFLVEIFAKFGLVAYPVPNILESRTYPFRPRKQLRPVFLHNRGLEEEYNVKCTLLAFSIIQKSYPEARLVIAHDGSLRASLEDLACSLKLRNTSFTGAVSQDEILTLYNDSDIYLTSANYDNFPGSILEAFACGVPVIATRAGGTSWIVHDEQNGLLVACGDYREMAFAACRLLQEQGLAESLSIAALRDLNAYSWENIEWQWIDLYTRLTRFSHVPEKVAAVPERECSSK